MFDLKKHLINEIEKSGETEILVIINNEIETNKVSFELYGFTIDDSIECFVNPFVFNEVLAYLFDNDLFRGFKVVNY